jgi:hypothetical protein
MSNARFLSKLIFASKQPSCADGNPYRIQRIPTVQECATFGPAEGLSLQCFAFLTLSEPAQPKHN